jgi:Protein of unknown function (DUF2975)
MFQTAAATQLKKVMQVSKSIQGIFRLAIALGCIGLTTALMALALLPSLQLTIGNGELSPAFAEHPAGQISLYIGEPEKVWGLSFRYSEDDLPTTGLSIEATPLLRLGIGMVIFLGTAAALHLLGQLAKLFGCYANGDIFTHQAVQYIRNTGFALLGLSLLSVLKSVVGTLLVAKAAPGAGWIDLSIDVSLALAAFVVLLIAWIMDVGRAIHEENELTI